MKRRWMYLAVFVGGAAGSLLREMLAVELPGLPFLTSTLGINVLACLVLGWLYAIRHRVHAHVIHLGAVGFCGGLSTFSSFMEDIARLSETGAFAPLIAIAVEIGLGLGAALVGEAIGRRYHAGHREP